MYFIVINILLPQLKKAAHLRAAFVFFNHINQSSDKQQTNFSKVQNFGKVGYKIKKISKIILSEL